MENVSKKQLHDTIKSQEEELSRYKKRFQDLVAAHKGLLKEKKTLEDSLKVMSRTSDKSDENHSKSASIHLVTPENLAYESENPIRKDDVSSSSIANNSSVENETEPSIENIENNGETIEELKKQLTTLMNSLATLSEEKSRMEAGFQADKKALRNEKEERDNKIKDLFQRLNQATKSYHTEIENYKSKLIVERHQREKEHHDYAVMIRELQKLLAEERSNKAKAEENCEQLKRELATAKTNFEASEKDLLKQMENYKIKLNNKEIESSIPKLAALQEEMKVMKHQHLVEIRLEKERALEAEKRAKSLAAMHEERVSNLEAKLTEISKTVGSYDRRRQEDLQEIAKLRENLNLVEVEKVDKTHKDDHDLDSLINELKRIKLLIDTANQSSDCPIDYFSIMLLDENESTNLKKYTNSDHSLCNEEYQLLKQQFENFKLSTLENQRINSPNYEKSAEVEKLKLKIKSLKEKCNAMSTQLENAEIKHKENIEEYQKALKHEKTLWENKLTAQEMDYRGRIADLEFQMNKQRERALALLNEKDEEISSLKSSFHSLLPSPISRTSQSSDKDIELLNNNSSNLDVIESRPMLHYIQELSRLQIDIKKLRKQKHILETAIRDIQLSSAEEEEILKNKINQLTEEVSRLERCQNREGANLEYLKNVVLSYLSTSDDNKRSHMLNAICTILQFSDSEKIKVSQTSLHKVPSLH